MILEARQLSFRYGSSQVLSDVHLEFGPGLTAIVGPNAAGKSTLLKCLCGLLTPQGQVQIHGRPLNHLSRFEIAQQIGYLPQEFAPHAVLSVYETVLLGRLPTLGWRVTRAETECVAAMLHEMQLSSLSHRRIDQLSGGQAQMVAIAQTLVREPSVLLMDEPTSNLDLLRQFQVCQLVARLTHQRQLSTVLALHDLNLAARFADRICVLHEGRVHSTGTPAEVLTANVIAEVYQMEARVTFEDGFRPSVTVLGPSGNEAAHEF